MANLRVSLRWSTQPGSTGIVLLPWEVCQREGDLVRGARLASGGIDGRNGEGVVAGVGVKAVLIHGVLFVLSVLFENESLEKREEDEEHVNGGSGMRKLFLRFSTSLMWSRSHHN